jgi:hypothetical protein
MNTKLIIAGNKITFNKLGKYHNMQGAGEIYRKLKETVSR